MPHGRTTNAQHRRGCGIRKFHMYIHSRNIQASQAFIPSHTVYFTVLGTIHTHLAFCFAFVHITCLHLFCVHGPPAYSDRASRFASSPSALFFDSSLIFPSFTPAIGTSFFGTCGIATQFPLSVSFLSSQTYLCLIIWALSTCLVFSLPSFFLFLSPHPSLLTRPTRQCLSQSNQLHPLHSDHQFQHVSRGGSH